MVNRIVPLVLIALLVMIQVQLWTGRGSVVDVSSLQRKLDAQQAANVRAKLVNDQLASEVEDLRAGLGMVEEKARMELGMVKPNEIFVQVSKQGSSP